MPAKPRLRSLPLAGWVALLWTVAAFSALRAQLGLPGMPFGLPEPPPWRWGLILLAIAGAALACHQTRARPLTALYLLVITAFVLVAAVGKDGVANEPDTLVAQFLLAADVVLGYLVASRPPWTWPVALLPVLTAAPPIALLHGLGIDWTLWMAYVLLPAVVAGLVGYSIRQAHSYARRLSEQTAAQAVVAERLRISRELHDQVAHSVGVIALQAGAAARVIDTRPEQARKALTAIETTSRDTLAGLRRMLGGLRLPEEERVPLRPAPTLADVSDLVTAAEATGVRVAMHWTGHRRPLPADVELSAYRIIQESLTNVMRHADASTCNISVSYMPAGLRIEVVDDGLGHGSRAGRDGYGLLGLHERVALLHGSLDAGTRSEGGFRVAARLPVDPGEPSR